ncbi:amino acid adenylation domain-containing protein [Winogradskyella sp. R77965]|uniref:amino acid adenylation domain-containing protein n=1 Tax=Winogradskyella sp. R77965 TaxID=3093872 RepID=UPI0037DD7F86
MKSSIANQKKHSNFDPFSGPVIEKVINITEAQAEIWIACRLGGKDANRGYNESFSLILEGELHRESLERAIQSLVQRHESLRAVFSPDGRFMSILKYIPVEIEHHDFSASNERDSALADYLSSDANYVFDLIKGPLIKIALIKTKQQEHHLVMTAHHIICDGWSVGIMLEDLGALYSAYVSNETPSLPKVESFSSYSDDYQGYVGSEEQVKTESFWLDQYKDSVPVLNLPTDFTRPKLRTYKSKQKDFPLDKELLAQLKKVGIKSGCSFVTTLLSAFEIFLFKYTGQNDIVLGLPSAGQGIKERIQLVGHCVNLLPLRSKLDADQSFKTYLKDRKLSMLDAYDHQQLSFGELLQKLPLQRDPSRVPLVPVVFNIDIGKTNLVNFKDLTFKALNNPRAFDAFEIFLNASGTEENFNLEWSFNSSLFKSSTIEGMMKTFEGVIKTIIKNPEDKLAEIVKIDDTAYKILNDTEFSYPDFALHDLISQKAGLFGKEQAIKFGDKTITYGELEEQVNRLAHSLSSKGVSSGDFVGVCLPRSIELIVSLIAIMKTGAAYLPLDSSYPSQRLNYMLEDSEANFLITTKDFKAKLSTDAEILILDDLFSNLTSSPNTSLDIKVNTTDVAYILYTSGSTGKPKGVSVTHKNLVNFLYSMLERPGIEEKDKFLSITTISFDIAGLEIFTPLLKGAELIIADDETVKDTRLMLKLIEKEGITVMQATPTTWQMLLDSGWEKTFALKALCGGEALSLNLSKRILSKVDELWNMYGPTETTIWSSIKQIKKEDKLVSIGKPIANTQMYVLNDQGLLVKPGSIGEICIAGDGVAKGYWKRLDLTNEKFIDNNFSSDSNKVLYRTGDLGKLLPSGELQCLGRIDQQVKIRGHRIELGEIEKVLDLQEHVQSSVVLVKDDRIVAYVLHDKNDHIDKDVIDLWKKNLAVALPAYMVPQDIHLLTKFPTTLNGKIDRKALINKSINQSGENKFTSPRTKTEQIISKIWCDCLGLENIDIFSDFFELGGHSLIAVRVVSRIEKDTGENLPLSSLMVYPTIEKISSFIDSNTEKITWDSLTPINTKGSKPPLYLVHGADYNILLFQTLAKNLDKDQPVYGLQAKGLNEIDEPHDSVEDMAAYYISEIIESNPKGPYALAGYSFGGVIAFEMAKQLKAQNREVTTIALLDSYVYPVYYYPNSFKKKYINFKYNIGQIGFMIKTMFSNKHSFNRRIGLIKKGFYNAYLRLKLGKERRHKLLHSWPLKLDEKHNLAFSNYQITPENLEVDLLKVSEDTIYYAHDTKYLGWKPVALKGVNRHMVPGNHANMFKSPYCEELGSILQNIINNNNQL